MCDFCGNDNCVFDTCLGCGKDVCTECIGSGKAVEYNHAVYFRGSGDAVYCSECDKHAACTILHRAYSEIARLREEHDEWYEDFKIRSNAAEAQLNKLLEEREIQHEDTDT